MVVLTASLPAAKPTSSPAHQQPSLPAAKTTSKTPRIILKSVHRKVQVLRKSCANSSQVHNKICNPTPKVELLFKGTNRSSCVNASSLSEIPCEDPTRCTMYNS